MLGKARVFLRHASDAVITQQSYVNCSSSANNKVLLLASIDVGFKTRSRLDVIEPQWWRGIKARHLNANMNNSV